MENSDIPFGHAIKFRKNKLSITSKGKDIIIDGISFKNLKKELNIIANPTIKPKSSVRQIPYLTSAEYNRFRKDYRFFEIVLDDDVITLNSHQLDIIIDGLSFRELLELSQSFKIKEKSD